MVKGQIRAWWLNAFTITATLLMWLWMVGMVVFGIAFASAASDSGSTNNAPVPSLPATGNYTDTNGYACDYYDTDSEDLCPANPDFNY